MAETKHRIKFESLTGKPVVLFALTLTLSLILGCRDWDKVFLTEKLGLTKRLKEVVLALWIILPPIWFWLEMFIIGWRSRVDSEGTDSERFDRFKYGQDLSAKVWLAVVTALLLLYFGKDVSP